MLTLLAASTARWCSPPSDSGKLALVVAAAGSRHHFTFRLRHATAVGGVGRLVARRLPLTVVSRRCWRRPPVCGATTRPTSGKPLLWAGSAGWKRHAQRVGGKQPKWAAPANWRRSPVPDGGMLPLLASLVGLRRHPSPQGGLLPLVAAPAAGRRHVPPDSHEMPLSAALARWLRRPPSRRRRVGTVGGCRRLAAPSSPPPSDGAFHTPDSDELPLLAAPAGWRRHLHLPRWQVAAVGVARWLAERLSRPKAASFRCWRRWLIGCASPRPTTACCR